MNIVKITQPLLHHNSTLTNIFVKPFPQQSVCKWCKTNLGYYRISSSRQELKDPPNTVCLTFNNEEDAILFRLVW